jgi:glycosyltransferase involved in cell wall biosynthesis
MNTDVSVVIPSYNSDTTIDHTLNALLRQRANHLREILVVDSSDNGKMEHVIGKYESAGVQLICAGIKVMPAIGRNLGASLARGKIVAFIDSDAYPAEDWLGTIVASYGRGRLAAGGSVGVPEFQEKNPIAVAQFYLQFNEYIHGRVDTVKPFVPSVNLYCDRELFLKAGGFPEIRAAEDTLFGFRISRLTPLWFVPGIKVFHIFREDRDGFRKNQKLLGLYNIRFRRTQYGGLAYRGMVPVLLFPGFLLAKTARMTFRIMNSGRKEAIRFMRVLPEFLRGISYWSIGFLQGCLDAGDNQ